MAKTNSSQIATKITSFTLWEEGGICYKKDSERKKIIIYYMRRIFTDQVLIFVKQIVYFTTLFFPKMVREANTGT